ncbi:hypothetical protein AAU61_21920 [Desulfocarbo indianensis]|nr:hypothetical protein AAU61_21920 [Desulfocarbo indianensis]
MPQHVVLGPDADLGLGKLKAAQHLLEVDELAAGIKICRVGELAIRLRGIQPARAASLPLASKSAA